MKKIPATILTGFLGAGKTTLLNNILQANAGEQIAIIVNEFGEINIDSQLIHATDEAIVELSNGCICCTVRQDLIGAVGRIMESGRRIDRFIIETTGLADPAPIIQSFMLDEVLRKNLKLDAIVTVVDAEYVLSQLAQDEAREQVAFADVILLNKSDRAGGSLGVIEAHLQTLNPLAAIHRTERSVIAPQMVLDVGAFDVRNALNIDPALLEDSVHEHDADITSVALCEPAALDGAALNRWLNRLVQAQGKDLLRTKGIVYLEGEPRRFVFHGVHMTLESAPGAAWQPGEQKQSQIVFIGRNLQGGALRHGFESCFASSMTALSP
jgi:G3E family GTPase